MKSLLKAAIITVAWANLTHTSSADLLLYYPFDLENGPVVTNQGTLEDGALVGGATYGESKDATFGSAFYGNRIGANDAYVSTGLTGIDLGMGASSSSGGVYTAMAWFNWAGSEGNLDHMVFGAEDGPGNNSMLHHGIRDDGDAPNAHFGHWGNDLNDAGVITLGEWTHLAFQFDGTDKVVYINGVESSRGGGAPLGSAALPVIIGGHGRDAADPAGQSFNGAIDEVKIYDEALTEAMIQDAMTPTFISDTDEDGLSDDDEVNIYNTNPNDPDTDDDGIEDGAEVRNGLDPNSAVGDDGASGDPDGDSLSNLAEIETHGTDPNDVDSDDDNFNDDVEIAEGSDPNDPLSRPQSSTDLPTPLLYYPFNVEAGTEVENLGTLSMAGVLEGEATYGESIDDSYGTAFYGNRTGANDAYVTTGFNGIDLSMGASSANGGVYTAMAWINWTGSEGNLDHMVFGAADGPGNNSMLHHGIRDDGNAPNAHFGHWGNDLNDAGVVTPGEWTHLAFQYDGADKVVYINGVESSRGGGAPLGSEGLPVIVGGHGRDAADPAGQSFNGAIDEVKVYAEALSDLQILAAMEPGSGGSGNGGLAVTSIFYDSTSDEVTLVFNSRPGRTYRLAWTADFSDGPDYIEIDDSIAADEVEERTSYTFPAPRPDSNPGGPPVSRAFFIIQQN